MFNLRSDLKIYTSDKYLLARSIIEQAVIAGDRYNFQVNVKIKYETNKYDANRPEAKIVFSPKNCNVKAFREVLELAGVSLHSVESISSFNDWAKNNPDKTWRDFERGIEAGFSLGKERLDNAFAKIRPDALMNELALSPNSKIAGLIGKGSQSGYRRRRAKFDRQSQLIRLWALFGVEVSMSAATKDLESILNGIVFHDFGITHCENMQALIAVISQSIQADKSEIDLAAAIKVIDDMIAGFGGKAIERTRPRSPYIRQVYDLINQKAAA